VNHYEPSGATPVSIPDLLRRNAVRFGERLAIADARNRLSFIELRDVMSSAGKALLAAGIGPGDRVAVWAPNSVRWCAAALGAMSIGAALVPVNTRFKGAEAASVLHRTDARLLVTVREFLGNDYVAMLAAADPGLADLPTVYLDEDASGQGSWSEFVAAGRRVTDTAFATALDAVGPDHVSDILFTSGTTGAPKGAVGLHGRNLLALRAYGERLGITPQDRALLVLPLALNFGLKGIFIPFLMYGGASIIAAVHEPHQIAELIERERITLIAGPPTLLSDVVDSHVSGAADLSCLRIALVGSTTIAPDFIRRLRESGLFEIVLTAYGLTEVAGSVSMSLADDSAELIAATAGKVLDGYEVRIVDDAGSALDAGAQGEILVRSATTMQGYLDDDAATAAAIDADGWLHTGDIGSLSADGYLSITDRKKDMFIVGGFNVYAAEVERMLCDHPSVSQCAVVGAPDARLGAVGVAFVVTTEPSDALSSEALIEWARDHMANYKVPRHIEVVDNLPLSASMKIVKDSLRAQARLLTNR
jgi:HIP---CoA ligase